MSLSYRKETQHIFQSLCLYHTYIHQPVICFFFFFLTLSEKVEKCSCIWLVCLSACSNSGKYFSKFMYVIYNWYTADRYENGMNRTYGWSIETHKSFWYIPNYRRVFLELILTYLFCIKCNQINMCRSNIQTLVSYKKWCKCYK